MADDSIPAARRQLYADHVETERAIRQLVSPGNLTRQLHQLTLFAMIDVDFWRLLTTVMSRDLYLHNDRRGTIGVLGENVDLTDSAAQVASQYAIALLAQVTPCQAFTCRADGLRSGYASQKIKHDCSSVILRRRWSRLSGKARHHHFHEGCGHLITAGVSTFY